MIYRLIKEFSDEDIFSVLSNYRQPSVSQFISINEDTYWEYVTGTDNVYFYTIYVNDVLAGTVHLELADKVLYMSIVVFPEYQNQGVATTVLKDIQSGKFALDFTKIQVSVYEKNIYSLKLFKKVGFVCVAKNDELLEYEYINS